MEDASRQSRYGARFGFIGYQMTRLYRTLGNEAEAKRYDSMRSAQRYAVALPSAEVGAPPRAAPLEPAENGWDILRRSRL